MKKIRVNASISYDVLVGKGLLEQCGELISEVVKSRKCALITDDIVDPLHGNKAVKSLANQGFSVLKITIPHGETSKSHDQLISLYNSLSCFDITRSDFIIALGGGVIGDLAGYCAATYLRGIDYIQIPTTLLAQVDSSVGGKTAVNIDAGKNLVGAFKQPKLVIADTDVLSTLSEDIFADGMGEVIKYGMIRSAKLFEQLSQGDVRENIEDIIAECVSIKRDVVQNDEHDTGERMILNFGHTFGHAIENFLGYGNISHGKAVAIGMYMMTSAAEKQGLVNSGTAQKLKSCLEANSLPYSLDITAEDIYSLSIGDKKRTSDEIRVILCPEVGNCNIKTMKLDEYRNFLESI